MKKIVAMLCLSLVLFGCGTTNQIASVNVTSEPSGANIDVNGVYRGKTPITLQIPLAKTWIGLSYSADGYGYVNQDYQFIAYPPQGVSGGFQKKLLAAKDMAQGAAVHFQFGVVTNQPLIEQRIEIDRRPRSQ